MNIRFIINIRFIYKNLIIGINVFILKYLLFFFRLRPIGNELFKIFANKNRCDCQED